MKNLPLKSFRLKNFKAVKDSGTIKFTPLTVFIGNNGSGKSSLIEGLETFQNIVTHDLDYAMQQWKGIEHILNKKNSKNTNYMKFNLKGDFSKNFSNNKREFIAEMIIGSKKTFDDFFIQKEIIKITSKDSDEINLLREFNNLEPMNFAKITFNNKLSQIEIPSSLSLFSITHPEITKNSINLWQFLNLSPESMGNPNPQNRTSGYIKLNKNGSNISQYLHDLRNKNKISFEGIIDSLKYVLPYAKDLQPKITSEIERAVYLELTEENFKVPSWLFSTGTLRILALLAVLRNPVKHPIVVIEEIENGLDPRTINFILEEIRIATESGTQVILTTHSPYLLDLIPLEYIIFVERYEGETIFTRPNDIESLKKRSEAFNPGELYTMSKFGKGNY
ncbi:MAG: ATP-binding protein [Candidatus Sericytochromatia bacterium]